MNKGTAYFLDGHKEIITEYNILENGQITFKTESGEYLHTSNNLTYRPGEFVSSCCGFYKKTADGYSKVDADRVVLKAEEKMFIPHPNGKLTTAQAAYIKGVFKPYDHKYGMEALAKEFGVECRTIKRVLDKKNWR